MKLNIRILLLGDHVTINIRSTVFTMKLEKIWFDVEMKKAMAKLVDEKDRCYSITSPAVKLVLTEANYMKQKALDLSAAGSPVNRAFNYVSALKRLVGISQSKRTMMNQDICLVDEISKNIFLMGSGHQVKFHIDPDSKKFHKNAEWDSTLGQQWDMLPPIFPKIFCHIIKSLKFSINNDFLLKTVRVSIDCVQDKLNGDDEYRRYAANNCRSQFSF